MVRIAPAPAKAKAKDDAVPLTGPTQTQNGASSITRGPTTTQAHSPGKSLLPPVVLKLYRWSRLAGFPLVALSLLLSIRFLFESKKMLQNDLFWVGFNATGGGVYVANAFNLMLRLVTVANDTQKLEFKLTQPEFASSMDFSTSANRIGFSSIYSHLVLFERLNTLEHGIVGIRRTDPNALMFVPTPFCWVDFQRRFSVAHTALRAERCLANDITNGAVYLEAFLRNVEWDLFLHAWGPYWSIGIEQPLNETSQGQEFLTSLAQSRVSTVAEEAAHWRSMGIEHFTMQWGTMLEPGIKEHISFVNALGSRVNFTIKSKPSSTNSMVAYKMSWNFANDLMAIGSASGTALAGKSLVRNTSMFFENFNISFELGTTPEGFSFAPADLPLRQELGPLGSIDLRYVKAPAALADLVKTVLAVVVKSTVTDDQSSCQDQAQADYHAIADRALYPVFPIDWRADPPENETSAWTFTGGNPFCSVDFPNSIPMSPFTAFDSCAMGVLDAIRTERAAIVFGLLSLGVTSSSSERFLSLCSVGLLNPLECNATLTQATDFIRSHISTEAQQQIQSMASTAHHQLLDLQVELMQFAVNTTNKTHRVLLHQRLFRQELQDDWNFFGWLYAYDWVVAKREVVRLEGDHGSMTLISASNVATSLEVQGNEIPSSTSVYLLRIMQYTTLLSIMTATLVLLYAISCWGQIAGSNLLKFNRVTGSVWIGRPLLIARGIVAVSMISTSQLLLTKRGMWTVMTQTRGEWYNVMIAANESSWFSYVVVDLLVAVSQGYTYLYAPMSSVVVLTINTLVGFLVPFEHRAEIQIKCEFSRLYTDIVCETGQVVIGSLSQFALATGIAVAAVLITFLLTRLCTRPKFRNDARLLLGGVANELFVRDGWVYGDDWYVDKASAVLTGLVTIQIGRFSRVLDVKTWSLLHLRKGRLYSLDPAQRRDQQSAHALSDVNDDDKPPKFRHALCLSFVLGSSKNDCQPEAKNAPAMGMAMAMATSTRCPHCGVTSAVDVTDPGPERRPTAAAGSPEERLQTWI